ncbi:16S rRNA (cytosine(1402)-N(4))-methyltransferase RsmH [Actinomyces slackii]|uniref:Ribosomal RNA small subunit methyltransferase H n=1 Tax=Actinomyces slackii TaxID=52774 RepID=A0A3S4UPW7_9ACTO|nr:16S rRNA (cytosine(1402)-N(4))-methyltransferase RsmH [Actinomyces slackii]VEG75541.1 Ribosomal RNA small subunit methyltransferase H [Actinomyces slackii]
MSGADRAWATVDDAGQAHDAAGSRAPAAELHTPVLLDECLDLLAPPILRAGAGAVMIDATLGMGGHSEGALERFEGLTVIGIDRDPQAIALAGQRLARFGERFRAVHTTYDRIGEVAASEAGGGVEAILMDLGVSSLQLDDAERGFSYARPAPLDMRMDQSGGTTAQDILDQSSAAELAAILRDYGEERFAQRIAASVVRRRQEGRPVRSTDELAELVRAAIPAGARRTGGHPAKRTFQALRIAVNAELDVLAAAVPSALNALAVGGRLVVESYQSLEDRIIKRALAHGATSRAPQGLPIIPESDQPYLELLTHGAARADDAELASNPRAASVRLRAAARTRDAVQAPAPPPAPPGPRAPGGRSTQSTRAARHMRNRPSSTRGGTRR